MTRLTKKQLLVDLEFLHGKAMEIKRLFMWNGNGQELMEAYAEECDATRDRIKAFINKAELPKKSKGASI